MQCALKITCVFSVIIHQNIDPKSTENPATWRTARMHDFGFCADTDTTVWWAGVVVCSCCLLGQKCDAVSPDKGEGERIDIVWKTSSLSQGCQEAAALRQRCSCKYFYVQEKPCGARIRPMAGYALVLSYI